MSKYITKKIMEHLEVDRDFDLEKMPDIIRQTLKFKRIEYGMKIALFSILACLAAFVCYKFYIYPGRDKYDSRSIENILGMLLSAVAIFLLFIALCDSVKSLLMIWISPKYFLINLFS